MKVEKILFPTDFSEGSYNALPYAVDLAKHYNAKLYILHVIYDVAKATGWYVPHIPMEELYKDMAAGAQKEMEKCCMEETRGFKNVEKIISRGIPHDEIIKFAKEKNIDMIVIGTHGRSGLDRIIFGSTAEKVVRGAPCPVMTVRLPEHRKQ
ncbi:MAG: universal stress protein [Nitrospirae bacterium]|nr:universal stress protein [Nitrospirota bacterium]